MRSELVNLLPRRGKAVVGPAPDPSNPFGITVTELAETTETGGRIWELAADDDLEAHTNSGGFSAFSADSQYMALKRVRTINNDDASVWYAVRLSDRSIAELMPRNVSGGANVNVIWAPTGHEFFRLTDGPVLEKWTVGGSSPIATQALAGSLSYHGGGTADSLSYRLQIGSGRSNPALFVYASGFDEHAVIPFDPTTLALSPHWWVQAAMDAGVVAGTTPATTRKAHNIVPMGSGYSFENQSNALSQYVSAAGGAAVAIEPAAGPARSHPAIRGLNVLHGEGSTGRIIYSTWGDPPAANLANESFQWEVNKTALHAAVFPTAPNPNYVQYHHGDLGTNHAIISLLNDDGPDAANPAAIIKVALADGAFTYIRGGFTRDTTANRRFIDAARPSISLDDSHACMMDPVDGVTRVYLMEV